MTEQLTRRQLRAARHAEVSTPEVPAAPSVAGDDASVVTSVPVQTDPHREFQLSAAFGSTSQISDSAPNSPSAASVGTEEVLTPDELLRKFRERIRSNYQEGSIPVPQAKLPASASQAPQEPYAFDIESIRERLRAAAEAARIQNQVATTPDSLQTPEQHDSEPLREISEFDIASRQSATSIQVEALRESFAGYTDAPSLEPATSEAEDSQSLGGVSRRDLRRLSEADTVAAPFSPEAVAAEINYPEPVTEQTFIASETPSVAVEEAPTSIPSYGTIESDESVDFQGNNLMAEPSTQSIVLDVIPDAVTMPINLSTDGFATGSISIIPEQSVSDVTGAIAGIKTDESTLKDTVTGAVSAIEPVSALAVIAERRHHAVLPMTSLRRGWWQPYAVAVGIFAMIGAAAYAVFLILEVLNS